MNIQFSKGRRFQSFPVDDENVNFLPGDRWEFTAPGKWVKNKDCTFIANGPTKQGAKAIDYTQKVHLRVVDVKTKDIVHTQISRFYPDDKIAGKRSYPLQTPLRRRKKREPEAPDNFALLKMEFEKGCGSFRQAIRLATLCMEETTCDRPAYREALAKMQDLLISASRISELIFSCPPLHYLCATDTANWTNGTLYGVRFSNKIKTTAQSFVLCRREEAEKFTALYDLKLERNGMWSTPEFSWIDNIKIPQVYHADFGKAIMWLVKFTNRDTYRLAECKMTVFARSHPDIDRLSMEGRFEEEEVSPEQ